MSNKKLQNLVTFMSNDGNNGKQATKIELMKDFTEDQTNKA